MLSPISIPGQTTSRCTCSKTSPDRHDPEPKAVACYGLLRADTQGMLLRLVDGRPVSAVTTPFLAWLTERLAAEGKTALLMVWDNAS